MTDFSFSDGASWIWSDGGHPAANSFVAFRRVINISGRVTAANLHLTADSRYTLFINGEYVGSGPPRSWLSPWPVDPYDLAPLLHDGPNIVAVLVQHFGVGTFQYLPADPGLLAQLDWEDEAGKHSVLTDTDWNCLPHTGFHGIVPRISVQQGWEEQYDARHSLGHDWASVLEDDGWPSAVIQAQAGAAPHSQFELRDIPLLTRELVSPRCAVSTDVVKSAPYTWSMNFRLLLNENDISSNLFIGNMLFATHIHSDKEQKITLHPPHGSEQRWKLNGEALTFADKTLQLTDGGVAHGTLHVGWNTLIVRMPATAFSWNIVVNVWTEEKVQFRARPNLSENSPWLALGPFDGAADPARADLQWQQVWIQASSIQPDATQARFEALWETGELTSEDAASAWARSVPAEMIHDADVFAQCASERIVAGVAPRIDNLQES